MTHIHAVDRATKALKITQEDLGRVFNVSKGAVNQWKRSYIPSQYCKELEFLLSETEDPMSCIEMRPEDWFRWWPELVNDDKQEVA